MEASLSLFLLLDLQMLGVGLAFSLFAFTTRAETCQSQKSRSVR